ncbi:hypothetical protein NDU88_003043 [Pleurodeles waltl]|uniref:Uncharacterized protein n=1 Tax=Pleurodeles waltl TaxID=8319 RepID=A0AAV7UXB9_PLEWA|nr:hypothetical protein NDU88_003043 [Pleurodeles waltl]
MAGGTPNVANSGRTLRRWARKTAEAQLGMASQRGRGACRILTLLMARIQVVAYPEHDARLRASQQPQASSDAGAEAPAPEGAESHRTQEAESTDGEGTSGTESEGSTMAETVRDSSDTDTSSDGSSLVVTDTSVTTLATATGATTVPEPPSQQPLIELPPHQQCLGRTTQSSDHQEVIINLDIQVASSSLAGEKRDTEEVEGRDSTKPEEARSEKESERSHG